MNKTELITSMADKSGLTKADSEKALKALLESVQDTLKAGDKVQLIGFGTFEVSERAARVGHDPRTGKEVQIPACKMPRWKAGKAIKASVNE